MSENYTFQRINIHNIADLIPIYKSAFKQDILIDFLLKKNVTECFGTSFIGYIAYDLNFTPAAFYGVYPCKACYKHSEILVAQSGDTMTDPEHQRKGLFMILAQKTYELAKKEGIKLVYGFPGEYSYPGFMKLDWKHFDDFVTYEIEVDYWGGLVKIQKVFNSSFLRQKCFQATFNICVQ